MTVRRFLAHRENLAGGDDLATPVGAPQDEAAGLVERLEDAGHLAIGEAGANGLAETGGPVSYRDADYSGRTALVVGSERYGLAPAWQAEGFSKISVPMLGTADSLNVSVSASVLLYEARARKNGW